MPPSNNQIKSREWAGLEKSLRVHSVRMSHSLIMQTQFHLFCRTCLHKPYIIQWLGPVSEMCTSSEARSKCVFGKSKKTMETPWVSNSWPHACIIWGFLSTLVILDWIFKNGEQVLPDLSMKWWVEGVHKSKTFLWILLDRQKRVTSKTKRESIASLPWAFCLLCEPLLPLCFESTVANNYKVIFIFGGLFSLVDYL